MNVSSADFGLEFSADCEKSKIQLFSETRFAIESGFSHRIPS